MAATQMNTRIDSALKRKGDEVLAKHGYSPSEAVRALWEYAAAHGTIPDFMAEAETAAREAERQRKITLAREGAGMALRLAIDKGLVPPGSTSVFEDISYDELVEMMYLEKLEKYEAMDRG
ncbi:type II toxin-antitoxin system RelB/DinJ family antitoxin [Raoultibacter phocaeensis]|uniref:type II toxin-antitoxin system RelB/DinJ family antitoxin n=1 Tax=Raoultibacter phocaeensis TaxID=2479841 RepID=UPI0011181FE1|nr:type II toxin-antitoxin system RelB/DinJ family antitoxin [Raoultibacter phocaeensis]